MRNSQIKAFLLGSITGTLITATAIYLAAPAKAEPDGASVAVAALYGDIICDTLDSYPSMSGIIGIGQALNSEGLTYYQAGQAIYIAVDNSCPRHLPLLHQFAASGSDLLA